MTALITSVNSAGGGKTSALSTVIPKPIREELSLQKGDQIIWQKTKLGWIPVKFIETK